MSGLRKLFGKNTWMGLAVIFAVSLAVNALGSLLLVKGVLPETSAAGCVYAAWGIGAVAGTCLAVSGQEGTLLRGGILAAIAFGLIWLLGFLIYNSPDFGGYGIGTAASICGGCMIGSLLFGGKKNRRHKGAGKRTAAKRRRNEHGKNIRK